jgi:hypothetical protein
MAIAFLRESTPKSPMLNRPADKIKIQDIGIIAAPISV